MTAHQQLSVIIRNQAKLMSVPELVPGNPVLSRAIKISLTPLQLISVRSSEGSKSSGGQLIQPPSTERISARDPLVVLPSALGDSEQTRPDGSRGILRRFAGHSASM